MTYGDVLKNIGDWLWRLCDGIQFLLAWLVTPLPTISSLLGFDVAPLLLIGVSGITVGVIRAIL